MIAQIVGWAYTTMSASSIIPRRNRSKDQKRLLGPFMYVYTFWVLATKRPWIAEEGCGGRHLAVIGGWRKFDKQTFSVFFLRQLRRTYANAAISHPSSVHHSPASLPLHLFLSSCDRITSTSPPPRPRPLPPLPPLPSGDFRRRPLKLIITPPPPPKAKSQKLENDEEERPPSFQKLSGISGKFHLASFLPISFFLLVRGVGEETGTGKRVGERKFLCRTSFEEKKLSRKNKVAAHEEGIFKGRCCAAPPTTPFFLAKKGREENGFASTEEKGGTGCKKEDADKLPMQAK